MFHYNTFINDFHSDFTFGSSNTFTSIIALCAMCLWLLWALKFDLPSMKSVYSIDPGASIGIHEVLQ